jgi:hypothetical protein
MHRLSSALLLGGAVLLTSYISAPAAPTPAPIFASAAEMDAIVELAPLADDVSQEAERLRARLAVVPERPVAQRDPFSFGSAPRRAPKATTAPAPEPDAPVIDAVPAIVWPKLVALLTDKDAITAVVAVGDAVEMLKAGETVDGFLIRDVTSTAIEIVHVATAAVTRLALR